ncbi:NPCBM/NEW2 domain-containing protein [Deinococcus geothermalis]|uniref:Glycosyl hydrolase family 98, putative carbohydrate binding module n=2 Tax=Deinococcus TaxID=1298 RepID=Q1J357_DEIGD|nr:NPCBM/NEW2 domain-containing protein [Deinococcus geothermalis]ABF44077.1 Glycosyl hydrolase family 98, putative carbohydrate binding module [Deinococcus geothermalis DSM 11300]
MMNKVPAARVVLSSVGLLGLTLALSACGSSTPAAQTSTAEAAPTFNYDGQDHSWSSSDAQGVLQPLTISQGDNTLSYENWTSATNGWGPIERNRSNGEKNAGDGRTLTIGGQTYATGFGVHAGSSMTFSLAGQCQTFTAQVGIDDEVGNRGSVVFQVFADGTKVYDSGVLRGTDAPKTLSVSVAGKQELRLVVTDAGDGISYDHADWANPKLLNCTPTSSTVPAPTPAPGEVTYSGPITITKGGTYSGNWESTTTSPAVLIKTSDPVIIENANIRGRGDLISGFRYRLTVRNVRGYGLNPNVAGKTVGKAVNAEENYSLRIENSYFENTRGIYVRQFFGDPNKGETIKILRNKFRNINGLKSDGAGGYTTESDIVQFLLFNNVTRIQNAEIAWNEVINEPFKSRTEENINMFKSSGTPNSPILIHDNYIQGAYPINPDTTTSYPGGGILLGDGKVTDPLDLGYTRVYNNQIVSTTNHGLAIAGGTDNQVYNNRVISSGRLPDGRRIPAANVGLYVWDAAGGAAQVPSTFNKNVMRDNVVGWTRVSATGTTSNSVSWFPNCTTNGTVCTGNQNIGTVTLEIERQEYQRWLDKLASAGVKVGP